MNTIVSRCLIIVSIFFLSTTTGFAGQNGFDLPETEVTKQLHMRGNGTFRRFGFKVFQAQLWTQKRSRDLAPPYALQLKYARNIKAKRIVDASIKEMSKQKVPKTRLTLWKSELNKLFPNVKKGDVLTGINHGDVSSFYHNGNYTSKVNNKTFGEDFFGIWLKPNTSEPKLRKQLLQLK